MPLRRLKNGLRPGTLPWVIRHPLAFGPSPLYPSISVHLHTNLPLVDADVGADVGTCVAFVRAKVIVACERKWRAWVPASSLALECLRNTWVPTRVLTWERTWLRWWW